jgi:transcriptional activator
MTCAQCANVQEEGETCVKCGAPMDFEETVSALTRAGKGPLGLWPVALVGLAFAVTLGGGIYWFGFHNGLSASAGSTEWYSGADAYKRARHDQIDSHAPLLVLLCSDDTPGCGDFERHLLTDGSVRAVIDPMVKARLTPEDARADAELSRLDPHSYPAMWLFGTETMKPRTVVLSGASTPPQLAGAVEAQLVGAAKDLVREGFERKEAGDIDGAQVRFNRALVLNPKEPEAYFWRGVTRAALGEKELAVRDLKTATELKSDYAEAYDQLGYLLLGLKRYDEAINSLTTLITLSPTYENGRAYQLRATARYNKGDVQNALADARQACSLGDPEACKSAQQGTP